MNDKRIFLDYAASTPMSSGAQEAYTNALRYFANPQAIHSEGLKALEELDTSRRSIAGVLGVKASEIVITSGGTESNNIAISGYLHGLEKKGVDLATCSVVVSAIEHPSVSVVFEQFRKQGLDIIYVAPERSGEVTAQSIKSALQQNTVLISVALVNSEIGTIQPLHAIAKVVSEHNKENNIYTTALHTDTSQGMYEAPMPNSLGVDLLSLDAGKMYGPRGVGIVYIRNGIHVEPVLLGGSQEGGIRPGTENVALLAGFSYAMREAQELRERERERLELIKTNLLKALKNNIPDLVVNGDSKQQAVHILNISIPNIDAEYVMMYLDQRGVALSTKSACLERTDSEVSSVVLALCNDSDVWRARATLRFSFGRDTREKDIEKVAMLVLEGVKTYRSFT